MTGVPPASQMVDTLLPARGAKTRRLLEAAALHGGVPVHLMFAPDRRPHVARARWAFMLVAREEYGLSFPRIAQLLGGIDQTSANYGCMRAAQLRQTDADFYRLVRTLAELARSFDRMPCRAMVAGDIGLQEQAR